ncbi:hypothetical protein KHA80_00825 [Anaerobacillus sp. HL2]|nr:hypothetical protein KHA80_00825 [Anaerobacillus sp. HL2]
MNGKQWLEQSSLKLVKNGGPYVVRDETMSTEQLVNELSTLDEIKTVEPNYFYTKQQQEPFVRKRRSIP